MLEGELSHDCTHIFSSDLLWSYVDLYRRQRSQALFYRSLSGLTISLQ